MIKKIAYYFSYLFKIIKIKMDREFILKNFGLRGVKAAIYNGALPKGVTPDAPLYYSQQLGTPVFADLTIEQFQYTSDQYGTVDVPPMKFDTILLTVDQNKNVVKTDIQGRNGTVKEYVSDGDYSVKIQGVINGANGVYPFDAVANLNKLLRANMEFRVISRWLQNLDIDVLVIESYSLPQMEGGYSYQNFEINCISDLPFELNI